VATDLIAIRVGDVSPASNSAIMMQAGGIHFVVNSLENIVNIFDETFSVQLRSKSMIYIDDTHASIKIAQNGYELNMTIDTLTWNGKQIATVNDNMTITHHTSTEDSPIGRFCETTGVIYDGYDKVGIKDCITKQKLSTQLNNKILGIITGKDEFASHGDVLVVVDEGEYCLGDLLVPTETGARVATNDEKVIIMINGLPRVRVTAIIDDRIPKINGKVCLACFIS
jgi:hypothetical protein